MSVRPSWRGHLRLSLVSCPVKLFTGTASGEHVTFNTLSRETHNRLRQQMFDPETGEVVGREDQVKGYEIEKGRYVLVEDEEVEALKLPSTQTIDIERFVDADEIDLLYWDQPYYMIPDGKFAYEAFAVIREAIEREDVVGIGRVVLSNRERPVAIQARGRGLLVTRLRSAEDVRRPEEIFDEVPDIPINDEMVFIAKQILERKRGPFDPAMFEDRYQAALHELIEAKVKGAKPVVPEVTEPGKVINLFDALKRSLDDAPPETSGVKPSARKKTAKASAGDTAAKPSRAKKAPTRRAPAKAPAVKQPKRKSA